MSEGEHHDGLDQSALTELLDALRCGGNELDSMREAMRSRSRLLIDLEATEVNGDARYERSDTRTTHRNGSRTRLLWTKAGAWSEGGTPPCP